MYFLLKKRYFFLLVVFLGILFGKTFYLFFYDKKAPIIACVGIEENGVYTNNMSVMITMEDEYGIKNCTVSIDKKEIINQSCNGKKVIIPVTCPVDLLTDGIHIISIKSTDSSWNRNVSVIDFTVMIDTIPLKVTLLNNEKDLQVSQGNTLHIKIQGNKKNVRGAIVAGSLVLPIVPVKENASLYEAFIPSSVEAKPDKYLAVCSMEDQLGNKDIVEFTYHVKEKVFENQSIKLVGDNKSTYHLGSQPHDTLQETIEEVVMHSPAKKLWKGERFFSPCVYRKVSTQFGVLRNSAERGKYRHLGVDLVGKPLSPVWACQDGIVVIKDKFLYTGNTIVIDHGCGILSLCGHLDSFDPDVVVGMPIKRGNIIGNIGMTGYATSYHLHWEVIIAGIKVNPLEWINAD